MKGGQEVWGLYGPGRAGSQALTGIPRIYQLRRHPLLADFSKVWPFETGFLPRPSPDRGPFVLHAEIWPGVVDHRVRVIMTENPDLVRDQVQMRTMCQWASALDRKGDLGALFSKPAWMDSATIHQCLHEEGWILGAR